MHSVGTNSWEDGFFFKSLFQNSFTARREFVLKSPEAKVEELGSVLKLR